MSDGYSSAYNDHVHDDVGLDDGRITRTVEPSVYFDEPVSAEDKVPIGVACTALNAIVNWVAGGSDACMVAARAHTMTTWIDPVHAKYKSLNEIAGAFDVTRSALSKALLLFKDRHEIKMSVGRLQSSRAIYAEAQQLSVANGTHCSFSRKNANLNTNSDTRKASGNWLSFVQKRICDPRVWLTKGKRLPVSLIFFAMTSLKSCTPVLRTSATNCLAVKNARCLNCWDACSHLIVDCRFHWSVLYGLQRLLCDSDRQPIGVPSHCLRIEVNISPKSDNWFQSGWKRCADSLRKSTILKP
jgi:hypothetical protein